MIPFPWRWNLREGWLDDLLWHSSKGVLPGRKRRGPRRVDDRRVISGISMSDMLWRDCPKEYGPSTTIYNRWHRWSQQGLWQRMFHELSQIVGTHYESAIDSTAIKVSTSTALLAWSEKMHRTIIFWPPRD
jgi:transposase